MRPPDLVRRPKRRVSPGIHVGSVQSDEELAAVDQPTADKMRDRRLGMLRLALNPAFRQQQPRTDERRAVAGTDIGIDDQIRHAKLVLDRHEHNPLRRPGSLPHQYDARHSDEAAGAGYEMACIAAAFGGESRAQQCRRTDVSTRLCANRS
jgi:hypothetical protein